MNLQVGPRSLPLTPVVWVWERERKSYGEAVDGCENEIERESVCERERVWVCRWVSEDAGQGDKECVLLVLAVCVWEREREGGISGEKSRGVEESRVIRRANISERCREKKWRKR